MKAAGPCIEIDQVVTGSPAFQFGLRPGMRILAVGRTRGQPRPNSRP